MSTLDRRSYRDARTRPAPPGHPRRRHPLPSAPRRGEPAPPPAAPGCPAFPASVTPPSSGQTLLAPGSAPAAGLETPPAPGPAGDRAGLAPPGLAPLLALALWPWAGTSAAEPRSPRADRYHRAPEPALGHRANPRRAAEARHRCQRSIHPTLPAPGASSAAQPELAYLPRQPRPRHLGSRPFRGPDLDLPDPLRLLLNQPPSSPTAPLRRHRPPGRGLGLAPDDRGHALGPAAQLPDP